MNNKLHWHQVDEYCWVERVGDVFLECRDDGEAGKDQSWYGVAVLGYYSRRRFGPDRRSLIKAKEDAVRLAIELLEDHSVSLGKQIAIFEKVVGVEIANGV